MSSSLEAAPDGASASSAGLRALAESASSMPPVSRQLSRGSRGGGVVLSGGHERGSAAVHRGHASYVESIGLYDYIFSLPASIPHYLFSFTPGCVACFAALCELDRLIILRLLFLQQHVSERAMRLWVGPGSAGDLRRSLQRLVSPCRMLSTSVQDSSSAAAQAGKTPPPQGEGKARTSPAPASASPGAAGGTAAASTPSPASCSAASASPASAASAAAGLGGRPGQAQAHLMTQYALVAPLKHTLLQYVLGGPSRAAAPFLHMPAEGTFRFPTKTELIHHSRKQWDALLRFIVEGERGSFACAEERGVGAGEPDVGGLAAAGAAPEGEGSAEPREREGAGGKKKRKGDKGGGGGGGPCEDLIKVLNRRRLLCRRTKSRRSLLTLPVSPAQPVASMSSLASAPPGASPLHATLSASAASPTAPTSAAAMSREAFSWILKDLKSQVNSLVVEFLFLLDGGVLTNAAHDAGGRGSGAAHHQASLAGAGAGGEGGGELAKSNGHGAGKRHQGLQGVGSRAAAHTGKGADEGREGASAAQIEAATKDMKDVLLLILTLGQSSVGQPISVRHLSPSQRRFVTFAINIGLIWAPPSWASSYVLAAPYAILLRPDKGGHAFLGAAAVGGGLEPKGPLVRRAPAPPVRLDGLWGQLTSKVKAFIEQAASVQAANLRATARRKVLQFSTSPFSRSFVRTGTNPQDLHATSASLAQSPSPSSLLLRSSASSISSPFSIMGMEAGMLVQSNFKVYVYTASALQLSVLSHLCELQARLPNLIVGVLTRASVLAAYRSGITADQIIRFLEAHAHPVELERKLRTNAPLLPENVTIQLRMWEAERLRLSLYPAVLLKKWDTQFMPELFQRSVRWAVGKNFAIYFTPWPEDPNSEEFREWMQKEKYLAIHADYKPEMVEKIRDVRDSIIKQQAGKT
ncbi:general transcription factor IIH polypeptide 4 GTF2H4 [Besnoitia besnoiti]|uniref:General transcription factor IIH subunit 4 n=1 Tax=Besnoitia besnoiti TaxID=94643 RepID=A0A2A9MMQ2_BESBE|nr:general transcription factor IIH polypeptide 4 GTF2H4 [Besnoitia besnoiti]PFH37093.1 general transcription factor IIH polypeptide 4 GTF2H4 [Besnoitia besnoiti]